MQVFLTSVLPLNGFRKTSTCSVEILSESLSSANRPEEGV